MEVNPVLFRDLTYIFLAAVGGGLLAWRLKLPLIVGFVAGGIVISPLTPGPHLSSPNTFQVFAEVGVVLLMFSIGVEFSIKDLVRVKKPALIGGPIGMLLITGLGLLAAKLAGWSTTEGIVIGATVSVTSTMVLARMLSDSGSLGTTYGRLMIGITLVEDLAVVLLTVVLPAFSGSGEDRVLKAAWTFGKALLLLIPLTFFALKVIPRLLRRAKRANNSELFVLVSLAICLGTGALAQSVGFSIALGAFLAGLSISGSEDLHHAHAQLVPLRDAFVALFFVSLGTLIDPRVIFANLPLLGMMLLLIVIVKFLVWVLVVRVFRYPLPTALVVAAGMTQIGELSFVLVQVAWSSGLVSENVFAVTLAGSLISIFLNVFIVRAAFRWMGRKVPAPALALVS
jgi:CPA2 family monovalent cation:H+ antiporter-2